MRSPSAARLCVVSGTVILPAGDKTGAQPGLKLLRGYATEICPDNLIEGAGRAGKTAGAVENFAGVDKAGAGSASPAGNAPETFFPCGESRI